MEDRERIQSALDAIDPSRISYNDWIHIGMAMKAAGFSCYEWDSWSMRDLTRYKPGDCLRKWGTFNGDGWGPKTIFYIAETQFNWTDYKVYSFDDRLPAYANNYDEVISSGAKSEEAPWQMAVRYLETLFTPDESVSYVHSATYKPERDKWVPADAGHVRKVSALIRDLKRYKNLDEAFGSINENAGAWIRHNPATGAGDKDITRYGYVLVESDDLPIEDQKKLMISLKLPIAAMIESGGKSVHAIVKIQAQDKAEYRQRVEFLFDYLSKHKFIVDENNKNPARLSRLPGASRNGNIQRLLATNIGCESWADWKDYIEGIDDDLPPILDLFEQAQNPPQLSPELIGGILREGNKMIITGESKAGKTCLSQELAVCVAEGKPWLNKFKCEQGKVLYMNLEVEEASLFYRFKTIYEANGWKIGENAHNIHPWNLRGRALPLDKLADKVIRRCRGQNYKLIILDPLYKVQQGDENSAEAISTFCNALDKIAHETGAAIVYDHHHPKGAAGSKKVIDRGAGSGVFARDADALCDLSFLDPSPQLMEIIGSQIQTGEKPMQVAFVLRDFKDVEPINIWFKFPVHYVDSANLLNGAAVEGSPDAGRQKAPNNQLTDNERIKLFKQIYDVCEENGMAKLSDMVDWCQGKPSEKTLRRYVDLTDEFYIEKGYVKKRE